MQKYWSVKEVLQEKIKKKGGFVNCHAHLDRAYTVNARNFKLGNAHLFEKWHLVDEAKKKATVSDIYDRMAAALENQISQGVQAISTFIDVDPIIGDKSIKAAQKLRDRYKKDIKIKYINQVLKGVVEEDAKKWFMLGAEFVDILGGLPGKDKGKEKEHIAIILDTAKKMGKMVHIHTDQLNTAKETETELLTHETKRIGMQGQVVAIHGVSIAAHPKEYRKRLYKQMKDHGVMLVACPTAWIDGKRSEELAPIHNSIAPVEELVEAGITVALGSDNIADIYKPFSDGDMWTELRFLLESCHFYDLEKLTEIATTNGLKAIGLK